MSTREDEWWRRQMAHILANADDHPDEVNVWAREELAILDALPGQARTAPLADTQDWTQVDDDTTVVDIEFPVDALSWDQAMRYLRRWTLTNNRRRYGKRYRQFSAQHWRLPQRRFQQRDLALPELANVWPPILLPGEPSPPPATSYLPARPTWWYPDGSPVLLDLTTDRDAIDDYLLNTVEPGIVTRIARTTLFRGGVRIWIATDFLAVDMGHSWHGDDAPPMLWETLIYVDGRAGNAWRYASRAAALAGHRQIVAALYAARQARPVHRGPAQVPPLAVNIGACPDCEFCRGRSASGITPTIIDLQRAAYSMPVNVRQRRRG